MYKVLIADDEPASLRHIEKLLSQLQQFTVCGTAYDGGEAYEKALLLKPDVIITDIRMPVMDGIALIEKLAAEEDIPFIIIVSGYSDFTYAQSAIRLGVTDYILKPVLPSDLSELMDSIADKLRGKNSFTNKSFPQIPDIQLPQNPPKMDTEEYYRFVCRYMEEHYREALTFSSACKDLGISQAHLSMIFRKYGDESFNSRLIKIRMEQAKLLMQSAQNPPMVRDIAEAVGYKDQFYFSRIFRAYTGISPTDYIRQLP